MPASTKPFPPVGTGTSPSTASGCRSVDPLAFAHVPARSRYTTATRARAQFHSWLGCFPLLRSRVYSSNCAYTSRHLGMFVLQHAMTEVQWSKTPQTTKQLVACGYGVFGAPFTFKRVRRPQQLRYRNERGNLRSQVRDRCGEIS